MHGRLHIYMISFYEYEISTIGQNRFLKLVQFFYEMQYYSALVNVISATRTNSSRLS